MSMYIMIIGLILLNAGLVIAELLGYRSRSNMLRMLIRYPYVILHEISHAFVGVIFGCGINHLSILPKKLVQPNGTILYTAGYYLPRYKSRFKLGPFNFGNALMALAGPVMPPILIYSIVLSIQRGDSFTLFLIMSSIFGFIILFAKQRWTFFMLAVVFYFIVFNSSMDLTDGGSLFAIELLTTWCLLGMVEEFIVLPFYTEKGSDMGQFTKNLILVDAPWLSFILNGFIMLYYAYMLYEIIRLLLTL